MASIVLAAGEEPFVQFLMYDDDMSHDNDPKVVASGLVTPFLVAQIISVLNITGPFLLRIQERMNWL